MGIRPRFTARRVRGIPARVAVLLPGFASRCCACCSVPAGMVERGQRPRPACSRMFGLANPGTGGQRQRLLLAAGRQSLYPHLVRWAWEEQFYLAVPLLFLLWLRGGLRMGHRRWRCSSSPASVSALAAAVARGDQLRAFSAAVAVLAAGRRRAAVPAFATDGLARLSRCAAHRIATGFGVCCSAQASPRPANHHGRQSRQRRRHPGHGHRPLLVAPAANPAIRLLASGPMLL